MKGNSDISSTPRTLAQLLLLAGGLAATGLIAWPIKRSLDAEKRIVAHQAAIDALARATRSEGGLASPAATGLVVAGETAGRASAELQQRLDAIASDIGVTVRSVQALQVKRQQTTLEVPVEVTLQADTESLAAYLHAIETGLPLIIVDDLSVRALPPQQTGSNLPTRLDVAVKMHAVAVAGEEKQP